MCLWLQLRDLGGRACSPLPSNCRSVNIYFLLQSLTTLTSHHSFEIDDVWSLLLSPDTCDSLAVWDFRQILAFHTTKNVLMLCMQELLAEV